MSEALSIGAHFILALDDKDSSISKNSVSLYTGLFIQCQYCIMVLLCSSIACSVISIVLLERALAAVGSAAWGMHIWWVKNYAIDLTVRIGQFAAIDSILNVSAENFILVFRNVAPKYALRHTLRLQ